MPQSLARIYVHLVYSTKNRAPFLNDTTLRDRAHRYLAGIYNGLSSPAVIVGGVEDHVHVLCHLRKTVAVADLVRDVKRDSSKWAKDQLRSDDFQWQRGYGAFSISPSHVPAITEYIKNQEEHHHTETFQEEFRRLCRKYGLEIDERYVWD